MAKTSFAQQSHPELDEVKPDPTPTTESSPSKNTPAVASSGTVATPTQGTVATPTQGTVATPTQGAGTDTEGEVNSKDIRLPRLNIVQKSGKLVDDFEAGSIVFDKELPLTNGKDPVNLTVLKIQKLYQEKLEYDPDGPQPRVFKTADEVRRAGGSTEYEVCKADPEVPYFRPMANILVLIEAPSGITPDERENHFIYEHGGKSYTAAMWTVTGSGYTGAAKPIFSAKALRLKDGLVNGNWSLTTEKKSDARNSWYAPVLKALPKHDAAFVEFAQGVMG